MRCDSYKNASIGSHADRAVRGKRRLVQAGKNPRLAKCAHRGYHCIFIRSGKLEKIMGYIHNSKPKAS